MPNAPTTEISPNDPLSHAIWQAIKDWNIDGRAASEQDVAHICNILIDYYDPSDLKKNVAYTLMESYYKRHPIVGF